jgi:hypothetical protein
MEEAGLGQNAIAEMNHSVTQKAFFMENQKVADALLMKKKEAEGCSSMEL